MKKFTVIYLPHGREDKEWMDIQTGSAHQIRKEFKAGIIINIEEQ